jgi:threonine aldolase
VVIDLRSDTVTLPSPAMREAIARAELGDDVYGEDPTVNRLEETAAAMLGKQAGLLVASGTMGNLAAMLVHCARGTKAIIGSESHTYVYEAGGASALGGIVLTPVRNTGDGELDLAELERELDAPDDPHFAKPALVAVENTHNRCGGAPVSLSHMEQIAAAAARHEVAVHLDGARIFNAAIALETTAAKIASYADSVSFCLSKGLACPVGSLLCGSRAFVDRARRARKMLGGGMRQAGIIAAAGIVGLETMVDRLAEDHLNARALAEGLAGIRGLHVRLVARRTNMVVFDTDGDTAAGRRFARALKERGVLIGTREPTSFRAVTHYGISRADINFAVTAAAEAAGKALGG